MITPMARPAAAPDVFARIREAVAPYEFGADAPADDAPRSWHALHELFAAGRSLPVSDAREALAPELIADLVSAGFARPAGHDLFAHVSLTGLDGLLVIGDREAQRTHRWFVPPPAEGTVMMAAATSGMAGGSALDIGTGGGALALLARHRGSGRVLATDVNTRALELVASNALLNGLDRIETREGSWFEPAGGERFDLITGHLPYVVGPERRPWRDAGENAEQQLARLAPVALEHLAPGGIACLMGNWPATSRDPGLPIERLPGADVLVVRLLGNSIEDYAERWSGEAGGLPPNRALAARWLRDLQSRGLEAISAGMLFVRRRAGADGRPRLVEAWNPEPGAGEHVLAAFAGMDELRGRPRLEDLLDAPLRPAMRLGVVAPRTPGSPAEVRMREGLNVRVDVDLRTRDLLHALDARPLREVLDDLAVDDVETLAGDVRTLLGAGMLSCTR